LSVQVLVKAEGVKLLKVISKVKGYRLFGET
jgi:hypothetical protein